MYPARGKAQDRNMKTNKMYLTETEARAMNLPSVQEQIERHNAAIRATREVRTPYGTIFRSGDREWFAGSREEMETAKAWAARNA